MRTRHAASLLAISLLGACSTAPSNDPRELVASQSAIPGCGVRTLVATGGPFPRDASTLATRWTGFTNYELAYNGQVILLDTYENPGIITVSKSYREPICFDTANNIQSRR